MNNPPPPPFSSFEKRFSELEAYQVKYGHCNVKQSSGNYKSLGQWCSKVRQSMKKKQNNEAPLVAGLSEENIQRLEGIGFDCNPKINGKSCSSFEKRFSELEAYKAKYGHCNVKQSCDNKSLGHWCSKVRRPMGKMQNNEAPIVAGLSEENMNNPPPPPPPPPLPWQFNEIAWTSLEVGQRDAILTYYLRTYCGYNLHYISWLIKPNDNPIRESYRRGSLARSFGREWDSLPFLSYTPRTKAKFRKAEARFKKRTRNKKTTTSLNESVNTSHCISRSAHPFQSRTLNRHHFVPQPQFGHSNIHQQLSINTDPQDAVVLSSCHQNDINTTTPQPTRRADFQSLVNSIGSLSISSSPKTRGQGRKAKSHKRVAKRGKRTSLARLSENRVHKKCHRPIGKDLKCSPSTIRQRTRTAETGSGDNESEQYSLSINASGENDSSLEEDEADDYLVEALTDGSSISPNRGGQINSPDDEDEGTSTSHQFNIESDDLTSRSDEQYDSDSISPRSSHSLDSNSHIEQNFPCNRTIIRKFKKIQELALDLCDGETEEALLTLKVALENYSVSCDDRTIRLERGKQIIRSLENEKWMQDAVIPVLLKQITPAKEEAINAIYGRNAIQFLNQLKQAHHLGGGRKGDSLHHAYKAVLSAIISTDDEEIPEPLTDTSKRIGAHGNTLRCAKKDREDTLTLAKNKAKASDDYSLCANELRDLLKQNPSPWERCFDNFQDVTVHELLDKIRDIYNMSDLLSESICLSYREFQRKKWKDIVLIDSKHGNEKVLRCVKINSEGEEHQLTITDFSLCIEARKGANPVFSTVQRQLTRIDNIDALLGIHIYAFCHDFEYVRVDSNCSRNYKVKLWNGTRTECCRQNWAHPGGDTAQLIRFVESEHYDRLKEEAKLQSLKHFGDDNPPKISLKKFRKFMCPCIREQDHAACVDVIQDKVQNRLTCINEWIADVTNHRRDLSLFRQWFQECSECNHEPENENERNWLTIMKPNEHNYGDLISNVCDAALCPLQEHPDLAASKENRPFKLRGLKCSMGTCEHCSIEENLPFNCEAITKCPDIVRCWVWEKIDEDDNNRYPIKKPMPISEVFQCLKSELLLFADHNFHMKWQKRAMKLDCDAIREDDLLIYTDYASGVNMQAPKSECCAHDPHAVLAVFVVLYGRDLVKLKNGETVDFTKCDHWFCVVGCESEGKSSDWITHGAAVDKILDHYINVKKLTFRVLRLWTDNCPPQYKNRQNFFQLALLMDKYGLDMVEHCFGSIYGFKGVWDALGKTTKEIVVSFEKKFDIFAYLAYHYYIILRNHFAVNHPNHDTDWAKLKANGDRKIKEKTPMMAVKRYVIYGTDDPSEVDQIRNEPTITLLGNNSAEANNEAIQEASKNDRIIYLNKEWKKKHQDTTPVPNTNASFHFRLRKENKFVPNGLADDDHGAIVSYFSKTDSFELKSNTPQDVRTFLLNFEQEWKVHSESSEQQQCVHCKHNFAPLSIAAHKIFCRSNPLNIYYPIEVRKRPCFCVNCRSNETGTPAHTCAYGEMTGNFQTHNMMRKSQSLKRDSLRRVINLVKERNAALDQSRRNIIDLIRNHHPEFPETFPTADCVQGWTKISETRKTKVNQLKSAANLMQLTVNGSGKNGNILKVDCEKAIEEAGGWQSILDKWRSLM